MAHLKQEAQNLPAPGDRVTWTHTPRGGYGFAQTAAAVVRKRGAKRIQIEVRRRKPFSKEWLAELKWVAPESLSHRLYPCAALGEPMAMEFSGFQITGWKHPVGNGYKQFPEGVWYGCVDGRTCTAPCSTEERAVAAGHQALIGGGYRAGLVTTIQALEGQMAADLDLDGKGAAELSDLHARLAKLDTAFPQPFST